MDEVKPGRDLEVDGGIDVNTARMAIDAGANVLVAGTAIFADRQGITAAIQRLRAAG
jgi:ribulose-phosphate 3-epimerase